MAVNQDDFWDSPLIKAALDLAWRNEEVSERTYGKLAYQVEQKRWIISGLEPQVAIRVKRIFPRISLTQVGLFGFADAAKADFMSGKTDLIIMSLRSGAGLDGLQHRCSTVAHGELDWSREVHKQLAGRLRPHQRQDPITELFFVADGGSDPAVASVQGLKASQAHGIVDPKRGVIAVQTDESRMKALARAYLERAGINPDSPFGAPA